MRLLFLIFTKIGKLNTREIFCNHQIAKLDTRKMFFPIAKLSTCKIQMYTNADLMYLPICLCSYKNNSVKLIPFLTLGILELLARKICKFFKK